MVIGTERWAAEVRARQKTTSEDAIVRSVQVAAGVPLIRGKTDVPYTVLGPVKFADNSIRLAGWGLRLRAGMKGADAVIEVVSQKCPELGFGGRFMSGLAVRIGDDDTLKRLRMRSYRQQVSSFFIRSTALLAIQAVLLWLIGVFLSGNGWALEAPSGETRAELMQSSTMGIAMLFGWPILMLVLIRVLRWPQLLRVTGLAVLAATTLRGLTVIAAHLLAVARTGASLEDSKIWHLIDPFVWAIIIIGGLLCARAWRLARETRQILPPEFQVGSTMRRVWCSGLVVATLLYGLFVFGLVGWDRYQGSAYFLRAGVEAKREQEALLALDEGAQLIRQGKLALAENSLQKSLKLWEELTAQRVVPPHYKHNLAITLVDLGWLHEGLGHNVEAIVYYSRGVAIANQLAWEKLSDEEFEEKMSGARQFMIMHKRTVEFRREADELQEKDRKAALKYEEAQVKSSKGDAAAEHLYQECIELWETVLAKATNEEYRSATVVQLATSYLKLGQLQRFLGKPSDAEVSLVKAIEYWERAMAQASDRPLVPHNLELSRRLLISLRDQAHQDAIAKLCEAMHFTDAAVQFRKGLSEAEGMLRTSKDVKLAEGLLAQRLERFAWFLGHNPVLLDTKAAVGYAQKATKLMPGVGDYWFTLGLVQYRNGDWRDSLASLDQLRAIEGENDGSGLLLIAMNRHQLGQKQEALAGLRKAVAWIDKRREQAEKDTLLMFYFEQYKLALEGLRREAETLIEGKKKVID